MREEKQNFIWNMTEEDWKRLMLDNTKKDNKDCKIDNHCYGQCFIGTLCSDILHTLDNTDWYAYANVFVLGVDDGYGTTKSGIPYTMLDDGPIVPMHCNSFEEFKTKFEESFKSYIQKTTCCKEYAAAPAGNWD